MTGMLERNAFLAVVRDTPLVSIDLVVSDREGRVLLGQRLNAPAQGFWFVPGGRIRKDETLADAFQRITRDELGQSFPLASGRFLGVYEHLYSDNFALAPGVSTHYVVLAFALDVEALVPPTAQHGAYRWQAVAELVRDEGVHANSRAYFSSHPLTCVENHPAIAH